MAKSIDDKASDNAGATRTKADEKAEAQITDTPVAAPLPPPTVVAGGSSLNPMVPNSGPVDPVRRQRQLQDVKRGDLVRLLVPHYDGYQLLKEGDVVRWWNDEPPDERNACLPEAEQTPLDAPPMTDGKPPADYTDPNTGRKPIIGSV